jgi:hypothetical protein
VLDCTRRSTSLFVCVVNGNVRDELDRFAFSLSVALFSQPFGRQGAQNKPSPVLKLFCFTSVSIPVDYKTSEF